MAQNGDMDSNLLDVDAKDSVDLEVGDNPNFKQPPNHFMGHTFHWSEGVFFLMTVFGVLSFILGFAGFPLPSVVLGTLFTVSSGTACALIWNLASIKRIASATALIEEDLNKFSNENERARKSQEVKRKQDADMKERLNEMQKAELILGGSVQNLKDIAKIEEEMEAEREELLKKRKELVVQLEKDLVALSKTVISTARTELSDRAMLYFEETDVNGDGMAVGSKEWKQLAELMATNGINVKHDVAGKDGNLTCEEFEDWLDDMLDKHFDKLDVTVRENHQIKEEIDRLKAEMV